MIVFSSLIAIFGVIFNHLKNEKHRKWLSILIILFLIANVIVGGIITYKENKGKLYSSSSGSLSGKLTDKTILNPIIMFGNTSMMLEGGLDNRRLMGIPLDIWIKDGELKVSTTLRDENGDILAVLVANEWKVSNSIFDKNFDENALEIIDKKGNVVLQLEFDGNYIRLAGIFYKEDGEGIYIGPNKYEKGILIISGLPKNPMGKNISIKNIFKYPAELHPGERI